MMRRKFFISIPQILLIVITSMLLTAFTVLAAAGTTDAPAAPGGTNSYTLEDIYQRLTNGTAGAQSAFTEPNVAPGTGSMHDMNALMAAAPALDDTHGASAADVLSGATFWGLTHGEWGLQTGSLAQGSDVAGADGDKTFNIPDGCYSGNTATAQDSDLTPLNIVYGANIFGVEGRAQFGWSIYDQKNSNDEFLAVAMVSATDGWAATNDNSYGSIFYHFDGSDWSEHSHLEYMGQIVTISMLSAEDGWAATDGGGIYHYNGAADTWEYHSYISDILPTDIDMVSATDGWMATGQGKIYRYISHVDSWVEHTDLGEYLADLEMFVGNGGWNEGWLAGMYSEKLYHYDGVTDTWSFYQDVHLTAQAISMGSANEGWMVGLGGAILHYNSATTTWGVYPMGTDTTNFYDIKMVSANDGWIVGEAGRIYHWDGSSWRLYDDLPTAGLLSLSVVNASDIWAVGNEGYFVHYMK